MGHKKLGSPGQRQPGVPNAVAFECRSNQTNNSGSHQISRGTGKGVVDAIDNCLVVANADQIDTNGDGIGNVCDLDFNNDCITNFLDFAALANAFGPVMGNEELDANSDGAINFLDISLYTQYHLAPPGPSASGCN